MDGHPETMTKSREVVLAGGGEMGRLMREHDWASTPLGPVETWPQSLRTAVSICLSSHFPMLIWWGPELVKLYNDAYKPILGKKHPKALGQRGKECWPEIWDIIGPMLEGVLTRGEATWSENQLLLLERNGFAEECYFTFSYSPIRDETGSVGGVFTAVTETTQQVLGARRLGTLRTLATNTASAHTLEEVCASAVETLAENPADIPFALLYLLSPDETEASLAGATGLPFGTPASPTGISLADENAPWPLGYVAETGETALVEDLIDHFGIGSGPLSYEDMPPPKSALVLPITRAGQARPYGLLVAGVSSRRPLDEDYQGFLSLVAGQIATAYASARAYQEAQERAEALAQLDQAKTAFFSNVSHEFRTPLTLLLGPLETLLADSSLTPEQRELVEVARRNGLRQLKLVNTLLDFSRIEAGRVQASYVPTDISQLTVDLASAFRSAIEKAGLRLIVECPELPELAYVDRDMWEKIVLNLLSNAFKFTFSGFIRVATRQVGKSFELVVQDTGVGIPEEELSHLFERFYRVRNTRARTQEGSGIGLALVQELVRLHGGSIQVESRASEGTTFTVLIPCGYDHLPAERISATPTLTSTALGADPYVEEAIRWLPQPLQQIDSAPEEKGQSLSESLPFASISATTPAQLLHLLVVDDNADMRDYLKRVLSSFYKVTLANDGDSALQLATSEKPDLIISDVMMPGLDGFGLLSALRANPQTRSIPFILLSARAGEEAVLEGLQAGANDYLVKPFSARELLARVSVLLEVARLRKEVEAARQQLHDLFMQAPAIICVLRSPEHVFTLANPRYKQLVGNRELIGLPIREALPEVDGQGFFELLDQVYATGEAYIGNELPLKIDRQLNGNWEEGFFNFVYQPTYNTRGEVDGILVHAVEVTEQVQARQLVQEREQRLTALLESTGDGIYGLDAEGRCTFINRAGAEMLGYTPDELLGQQMHRMIHHHRSDGEPYPYEACPIVAATTRSEGTRIDTEVLWRKDGTSFPAEYTSYPIVNNGKIIGAVVTFLDITERKALEQSRDAFIGMASHELRNPITSIKGNLQLAELRLERLLRQTKDLPEEVSKSLVDTSGLLARALRQTGTQIRLINDLLDLSRLQVGKLELSFSLCDLTSIVRETIADQRAASPGRTIIFEQEEAEPIFVQADADRIGQVVSNYLTNALKYSPASEPVTVGMLIQNQEVHVWVRDHGPGLTLEQQQQVWGRFYQVPGVQVQSGSGQGLGLGLYICQTLISRHNGKVGVESKKGEGSTFWFTLPRAE
ncbi:MAG TPA: ATP-binding protein [Ktedonobacteraceae bacterium]|jgi:PAS domain S-box-containing protein|nr:ATP-binding protein [Ktedonobacteraceae bacterium]